VSRFDVLQKTGSTVYYLGTFNGNMQNDPDVSFFFRTPIVWMTDNMSEGAYIDTNYSYYEVNAKTRQQNQTSISRTARVQYYQRLSAGTYNHPELGLISAAYGPVIHFKYWPDVNNGNSLEEYWLLEGKSFVRSYTHSNSLIEYFDPASITYEADIPRDANGQSITAPQNPWYGVDSASVSFGGGTYHTAVYNGAFENTSNHLAGWTTTSADCLSTTDGTDPEYNPWGFVEAGEWKAVLRGSSGGGDAASDAIVSTNWIPVIPGRTYRLSGYIWRVSGSDNAYLDLDDGYGVDSNGSTVTFTDVGVAASGTNQWDSVGADVTIPANVYGIKVRCVRDGANAGNAYFDDIRFTLKQ
jgi:hypothetical protein